MTGRGGQDTHNDVAFLFPDMAGILPGNSSWWSSPLFILIGEPAPPPQLVMNQPPGTYGISFDLLTRFMTDDLLNGWSLSSTSTFMNYHDINK
jgi:hypothetical protein